MSYMVIECPWCGERYTFGIVGTTQIGSGHCCRAVVDCLEDGCPKPATWHVDDGSKDGVLVCTDHIEGRTIRGAQPRTNRASDLMQRLSDG